MNCWEYTKCGREAGGEKADEYGVCPAYPLHGTHCAKISGTLCNGTIQGSFAMKLGNCLQCPFFMTPHYDAKWQVT